MPRESSPGWVRVPIAQIAVVAANLAGTSQIIWLDTYVPGFKCVVEEVEFIQNTALAGAGGSQTINVRKGDETGTVLCTINPVLADAGVGATKRGTVSAALQASTAILNDTDSITVEMAASGTAFTGGAGTLIVWGRQRPQAAR